MEAAMTGVPAMAVSVDWASEIDYGPACALALLMLRHFEEHPMPTGVLCNLNVPMLPLERIGGPRLALLDPTSNVSGFERFGSERAGDWYFTGVRERRQASPGSDRALLDEGFATVTYLSWRLSVDAPPFALPAVERAEGASA
jgi:5'-nucleotidase